MLQPQRRMFQTLQMVDAVPFGQVLPKIPTNYFAIAQLTTNRPISHCSTNQPVVDRRTKVTHYIAASVTFVGIVRHTFAFAAGAIHVG
ncbi:MAG: hypothetical protein H6822_30740 [Planctomycetaceae bacterium]|nr:hypothetical protein [Planctomycetaceae bacterium]